jgi:hypothetical protein
MRARGRDVYRLIVFAAFLFPAVTYASEINYYSGFEVMRSGLANDAVAHDGLLVLGMVFKVSDYIGVAVEGGLGSSSSTDPVASYIGSVLVHYEPIKDYAVSPVVFGGYSRATLSRSTCEPVYMQSAGYTYVDTVCSDALVETEGATLGLGVAIKRANRGALVFRYSTYTGSEESFAQTFSISASF